MPNQENDFRFGLEAEFLLVDATSFEPLWHDNLKFKDLNEALESISVDDIHCDSFKVESPHQKAMPSCDLGMSKPRMDATLLPFLSRAVHIRIAYRLRAWLVDGFRRVQETQLTDARR